MVLVSQIRNKSESKRQLGNKQVVRVQDRISAALDIDAVAETYLLYKLLRRGSKVGP